MSVAEGTLTAAWRGELFDFYGIVLGWKEMESLRLPDRLTISVGRHSYVNVRERPVPMICTGYEHVGIVVASREVARDIWNRLQADARDVNLEPFDDDGFAGFRFRYMLPLAVEVQAFS